MGSIKDIFVGFISNTKNKLLIAGISVIILLFLLNKWNYNRYKEQQEKVERTEANLHAAQDTIRVTKDKNGRIEYNKLVYTTTIDELKQLNSNLSKELEAVKGKPAIIQDIGFKLIHDSIPVITTVSVEDSVVTLRSSIDTIYSGGNFRNLSFESVYNSREGKAHSLILSDNIGFDATVGIKLNEKKQYEIFVTPHFPGMEVSHLDGAIIEDNFFNRQETTKKVPLITLGGNIGWVPFTYDLNTQKGSINLNRIGASVGLNFNLGAILRK